MMNRAFNGFLACTAEYAAADTVLFGAPFDSTTSFRPGARFGCREIRSVSEALETYSPYQDGDLESLSVFDAGDLELPFGDARPALNLIRSRTAEILSDGKRPFLLGGEHLVTLGAVRAVFEKHPELAVVQLDAHADLREDYLGERLSHACVMRRIWELLGDGRIYQFGVRSGTAEEFLFASEHIHMQKFSLRGLDVLPEKLRDTPVYLTIDLDVLDPSVLPGTGTPEAGGVGFNELLNALIPLKTLNLVALDITELSPPSDICGISSLTAAKLLRELLLIAEH